MHSHKTCLYQKDAIVLPRLVGNRELAQSYVEEALGNGILSKEFTLFARAVSFMSHDFADELMLQLSNAGVKNLCVRGGYAELVEILKNNSHGVHIEEHLSHNQK